MDKAVEALNSVYRALLGVCALLAILAVGATEDPRADTHALYALKDLRRDHVRLTLELAAQLKAAQPKAEHGKYDYRTQMLAVASPANRQFLSASRFGDWAMDLVWDAQKVGHSISLDGGAVTVGNLLDLASKPDRGLLHRYHFDDPADLRRILDTLLDDANEAFLTGKGFVKVGPNVDKPGLCTITAGPFQPSDEVEVQRGFDAKCSEGPAQSIDVAAFGVGSLSVDVMPSSKRLLPFAGNLATRHVSELQLLAAEEASRASTDVEVFGLKVPKVLLLLGGPALIALLLVQMWSQLHVAARADAAAAKKGVGLAWFGLFSGHVRWFMLASLVVVPTLTSFGLGYVNFRPQSPDAGAYVLAGLAALLAALVPLIIATAVWLKSVALAQTWGLPGAGVSHHGAGVAAG